VTDDLPLAEHRPFSSPVSPAGSLAVRRVWAPGRPIRPQRLQNWCWAAVTEFVHRVFGRDRTQCAIVHGARPDLQGCDEPCQDGAMPSPGHPCNAGQMQLSDVLREEALLSDRSPILTRNAKREELWATIREEISAGRPICFEIRHPLLSGHFAVISGVIGEGEFVEVMDPAGGEVRIMLLSTLLGDYPCWRTADTLIFTENRDADRQSAT